MVPAKLRSYLVTSVVTSLFLLAGTITSTAVRSSAAEPQPAAGPPAAPKVTVASVEERLLADSDEITGHVEATETVELRARVSGHLDSVHFQAGQLVKAGDLLFTIDPRWYQAQFDLAAARSEVAEREAKRSDELLAAQAVAVLAKTRYDAGYVSYLDVIDAERTELSSERGSAQLAAQRLNVSVALIKALGGGWSDAAAGRPLAAD